MYTFCSLQLNCLCEGENMSADQQAIAKKQEEFIEAFENSRFCAPDFKCSISGCLMSDPVILSNGRSYDREGATALLKTSNPQCTITRESLNSSFMIDNINLKGSISSAIEQFKKSPEGEEYANFNYDPTVKFIYENRVPSNSRGPIPPPSASSSSSDSFLDSNCGKMSVTACLMGAGAPAAAITIKAVGAQLLPCSCGCCLGTTAAGTAAFIVSTAIGVFGIFAFKKGYEAFYNESPAAVVPVAVVPVAAPMGEEEGESVAGTPAAMLLKEKKEEGKEEEDGLQQQRFISYGSMNR